MPEDRSETRRFVVCPLRDLPPGERKIVEVERRSIGVFNVHGQLYALRNRCPHKGAPLCRGVVTGLVTSSGVYQAQLERQGEILKCPWHGWEFDLTNGQSVFNPHRVRVKSYEVAVEGSDDEPSIDTYPVTVEQELVVLHLHDRT